MAALNQWHAAAEPFLREGQTKDEYRMEFLNGYRRLRHPLGNLSLEVALERARTDPLPVSAREFEDERIQLLIAWCWQLQKHVGDHQPFYLSCRDCGRELSISHVTAAQWLSGLCAAGILRETEKGSRQTGKASRYRFTGALAAIPVAENAIENGLHSGSSTL
jgi:hypothetical protein